MHKSLKQVWRDLQDALDESAIPKAQLAESLEEMKEDIAERLEEAEGESEDDDEG